VQLTGLARWLNAKTCCERVRSHPWRKPSAPQQICPSYRQRPLPNRLVTVFPGIQCHSPTSRLKRSGCLRHTHRAFCRRLPYSSSTVVKWCVRQPHHRRQAPGLDIKEFFSSVRLRLSGAAALMKTVETAISGSFTVKSPPALLFTGRMDGSPYR